MTRETIEEALKRGARALALSTTPTLDARVMMMAAIGCDEARLVLDGARALTDAERAAFEAMVERRARQEPIAHIVGRKEFWSLDIEVGAGILVPRPDSETLISAVVARRNAAAPLSILDLGCGSGALLGALLSAFPNASGLGVDISEAAVALTARNLARLGQGNRAHAKAGDWFADVDGRFDVIISNPPYIPVGDRDILPREVAGYEDERALFAGVDGLEACRRILAGAPRFLAQDGLLVLEFGEGQETAVKDLARRAFPTARTHVERDLAARPRAIVIDLGRRSD